MTQTRSTQGSPESQYTNISTPETQGQSAPDYDPTRHKHSAPADEDDAPVSDTEDVDDKALQSEDDERMTEFMRIL